MLGLPCWTLLLQILLLVGSVCAKSATGDRVLVVHEEDSVQSAFSQFFDSLKSTALLEFIDNRSGIPIVISQSETGSVGKSDKV